MTGERFSIADIWQRADLNKFRQPYQDLLDSITNGVQTGELPEFEPRKITQTEAEITQQRDYLFSLFGGGAEDFANLFVVHCGQSRLATIALMVFPEEQLAGDLLYKMGTLVEKLSQRDDFWPAGREPLGKAEDWVFQNMPVVGTGQDADNLVGWALIEMAEEARREASPPPPEKPALPPQEEVW